MASNLKKLPVDERIRLVQDLWDSIATDQTALALSPEQRAELDRRIEAFEADRNPGRTADQVISDLRKLL